MGRTESREGRDLMDLEPWIHFAHVGGAIIWVGGGLTMSLIGLRVRRSGDIAVLGEFARTLRFLGLAVFTPAVLIVLLSGVWLVLDHSGDFTRPWILLALVAFALAFLIGVLYLSRSALRLERVVGSGDVEAARDALGSWLSGYAVVLAILVFALWDMVFKPGT
jgi:uncharacterized membrane protein